MTLLEAYLQAVAKRPVKNKNGYNAFNLTHLLMDDIPRLCEMVRILEKHVNVLSEAEHEHCEDCARTIATSISALQKVDELAAEGEINLPESFDSTVN